jgi:cholesterol transport system auxiliary component
MTVRGLINMPALAAAIVATLLTGCSGFKSNSTSTQIYLLQPELPVSTSPAAVSTGINGNAARSTLAVLLPMAAPGLANERIALTRSDGRLDYFGASRWPAELPEVLQTLTIDALRARGRFASVQNAVIPSSAEYALQIEVRHFEAQYPGTELGGSALPAVQVTLVCTLIRRADRTAVVSFTAETSVPAAANRMSAVMRAFDEALGSSLQQLVEKTTSP